MKKYELTTETLQLAGLTLHRIKAVKNFGSVKAGELGGWIESEENLSQADNAWVYNNAKVFDKARVYGDAAVSDDARVYNYATIYDNARVYNYATIYDNARVYDNAEVSEYAEVCKNAKVCGYAKVCDNAQIFDYAKVYGYAEVYGNVRIYGNAAIKGDAKVYDAADYIVFKNFWSSGRYFTWTRSNNKWSVGCFHGTGEELIKKAYADSEKSGREYERVVRYVESILADERK
jgi:carbonic anhydrase/acetyltransferase-like protein (isoleucine patch superfamily)